LYRNNGDGTFTDVGDAAVRKLDAKSGVVAKLPLRKDGRGIGAVLVDLDLDGRPDIYVANDTDDNFLYRNRGEPFGQGAAIQLEELGLVAGVARDDKGQANGSMGLAVGDYDHSGKPSILVTNYESELPALYKNRTPEPGKLRFAFATQSAGVGAINGVYVSWGTAFADFNLDGWDDLHIVNGHAIRHPHKVDRKQKPVLLLNQMGKFAIRNASGGSFFTNSHNCRGTAIGDLDNDGKPDMVIVRHNEPAVILHNIAPMDGKHWVGLQLTGVGNRCLVGSRVEIETALGTQTKFVRGGASFGSTDDPRLLFGLNTDGEIKKATIHWSHGGKQSLSGLALDKYTTVGEVK